MLAENGRLGDTHNIADKFEELMMASRGEVKAVVTSAEARARALNPSLGLACAFRASTLPRRPPRCRSRPRRRHAGGMLPAGAPARLAQAAAVSLQRGCTHLLPPHIFHFGFVLRSSADGHASPLAPRSR